MLRVIDQGRGDRVRRLAVQSQPGSTGPMRPVQRWTAPKRRRCALFPSPDTRERARTDGNVSDSSCDSWKPRSRSPSGFFTSATYCTRLDATPASCESMRRKYRLERNQLLVFSAVRYPGPTRRRTRATILDWPITFCRKSASSCCFFANHGRIFQPASARRS